MSEPIIGVNIEDNHISVGLVNIETRKVVPNTVQRKRVDRMASADRIIDTWTKVLKEVAGNSKKIGVGLPGECDYKSGAYTHNDPKRYYSLHNANLKEIFANALGFSTDDVILMNDAACFLQGEVFGGSGRGFKSSLGVTLGIGLGTSIYSNGIVTDANLYSSPLFDSTAEDYISIRFILKRFKELTGIDATDISELRQMAETEPRVQKVFDEFANNLYTFLIGFIKKHNPEVVVIGGFMEIYNRFFFDNLTDRLKSEGYKLPVLRAILSEQASIIGAASSWYTDAPLHV